MIATSGFLTALECTNFVFDQGSTADLAGKLTELLQNPSWFEGTLLLRGRGVDKTRYIVLCRPCRRCEQAIRIMLMCSEQAYLTADRQGRLGRRRPLASGPQNHNPLLRIRQSGLRLWLGLGSGSGQKFARCACAISKLRSTFCKLRRLTNCAQQ